MTGRGTPTTRGDIQGMRALAVVLVVLAHAGWRPAEGGFIGVDVFFVISGFLITGILGRSLQESGRIGFADFYARRALRILPVASVVLTAICIASSLLYTSGRLRQVLDDSVWAALFGANIHYANTDTSYFGANDFVSPMQHYWSLAVEEQFYLFWPLIAAGGVALARTVMRRRLGPVADSRIRVVGLRYAGLAVLMLCLVSLGWSWHRSGAESAYFSTFTRAYELGAGALLALIAPWCRRRTDLVKATWSWLGLAAVLAAAALYSGATPFPGVAALLPVLGTALLIAGGIEGPRWGASFVLDRFVPRKVGDLSFSFYLWHWPLLILPAAYLGRDLSGTERTAAVCVAFTLAALSYRCVEQPFRRARARDDRRRRALVVWPVAVGLVIGTSAVVWAQQGPPAPTAAAAYVPPPVDPEPGTSQKSADELVNEVGFAAELARANYRLPENLVPALTDLTGDITLATGYRNSDRDCFATTEQVTSKLCRTGKKDGSGVMVALGDSHMGMWLAPITRLAAEADLTVIPMLKQRCLPFALLPWEPTRKRPYDECAAHTRWTLREIKRLKPDVIVISALYQASLTDPSSRDQLGSDDATVFAAGVRATLTQLRALAPKVLLIGPTPLLEKPAATCLGSRRATMGTCRTSSQQDRVQSRNRVLAKVARQTGVGYQGMLPWLCDAKGTCPVVIANRIVYRDDNHITQTYAEHLLPVFRRALGFG